MTVETVESLKAELFVVRRELFETQKLHLGALTNRVLELTPEGPVPYGGGYSEYVARTGREAPGIRHLQGR